MVAGSSTQANRLSNKRNLPCGSFEREIRPQRILVARPIDRVSRDKRFMSQRMNQISVLLAFDEADQGRLYVVFRAQDKPTLDVICRQRADRANLQIKLDSVFGHWLLTL